MYIFYILHVRVRRECRVYMILIDFSVQPDPVTGMCVNGASAAVHCADDATM